MPWNTREKEITVQGQRVIVPVLTTVQNCEECGNRLENPFKSDPRDADTWIWTECVRCESPTCDDCSDFVEEEGGLVCVTCLQSPR